MLSLIPDESNLLCTANRIKRIYSTSLTYSVPFWIQVFLCHRKFNFFIGIVITFITLTRLDNSKTKSEPLAYQDLNEQISGYIRYEEKDFQPLPSAADKKIAKLIDDLKQVIYF